MVALRRAWWLSAALVAPVLVCASTAASTFGLRCRMSGVVSMAACCPTEEPADVQTHVQADADDGAARTSREPPAATLGEAGCCERLTIALDKPIADATPARSPELRLGSVVFVGTMAPADAARWRGHAQLHPTAQPRGAPVPRFLLSHALLI
jgi:hypothetical protein